MDPATHGGLDCRFTSSECTWPCQAGTLRTTSVPSMSPSTRVDVMLYSNFEFAVSLQGSCLCQQTTLGIFGELMGSARRGFRIDGVDRWDVPGNCGDVYLLSDCSANRSIFQRRAGVCAALLLRPPLEYVTSALFLSTRNSCRQVEATSQRTHGHYERRRFRDRKLGSG